MQESSLLHTSCDEEEMVKEEEDEQQRMIHLAYLFSSPLVLETSEGVHFDTLAPISYKEEFQEIITTISEQKVRFRYKYKVACEISLKECLNDNPLGLHFSGHGFENNESLF